MTPCSLGVCSGRPKIQSWLQFFGDSDETGPVRWLKIGWRRIGVAAIAELLGEWDFTWKSRFLTVDFLADVAGNEDFFPFVLRRGEMARLLVDS